MIRKSRILQSSKNNYRALIITTVATISAIVYSHYSQIQEKQVMRAGVERDKERMRMKRKLVRNKDKQEPTS